MKRDVHHKRGCHAHVFVGMPVCLLEMLLCGCGYSQSGGESNKLEGTYHWNSLYREDIQTVAIPVFSTKDFRRGIEFRLTEAVIKQLEAHAPYKVVPQGACRYHPGRPGRVRARWHDFQGLSDQPSREQEVVISVDLTWKDLRTGKILLQRKNLQQDAVFYPQLGEGEYVGAQTGHRTLRSYHRAGVTGGLVTISSIFHSMDELERAFYRRKLVPAARMMHNIRN